MITKSLIIFLFLNEKSVESEHWALLPFLILITGINVYFTLSIKNRQNEILMSLNIAFSLILFLI